MIKYLRLLLLPLSLLYGIVTLIRNKLYDWRIFPSVQFDMPVICVGNLVVGGSGKTPVTEYLVRLLAGRKIAILSRGYGRKTTGFILADGLADAGTIGDEPMQFYRKFPEVTVAVCEDRVKGIHLLKEQHDLIILDDAFQHRSVRAGYNILLFEYQKLLSPQFLLPAGNLREIFGGYKRAQSLLVTKTPEGLSLSEKLTIKRKFGPGFIPSFSEIKYGDLVDFFTAETKPSDFLSINSTVFLLTGIANPAPLVSYIEKFGAGLRHHNYADHHQFTHGEIERLVREFEADSAKEKIIITTEKDAQRLSDIRIKELLLNLPVFYLPIQITIAAEDKAGFDQNILDYVSSHTRNR